MSIITLCTDFGVRDSYVASMKGIILGINSSAVIPAGIIHTGVMGSIVVKGYKIKSMVETYEQCDKKHPCALINSFNSLEIAINSHSAHKVLGINAGDKVTVLWQ